MKTYQNLLDQGERLVDSGDHVSGIRTYAEAARVQPERKEAFMRLGLIYNEYGDPDGAMRFLEQAAGLDDGDAYVRFNLGLIQYRQGLLESAQKSIEAAVRIVQEGVDGARIEAEEMAPEKQDLLLHQCDELEQTATDARMLLAEIAAQQEGKAISEMRSEDVL